MKKLLKFLLFSIILVVSSTCFNKDAKADITQDYFSYFSRGDGLIYRNGFFVYQNSVLTLDSNGNVIQRYHIGLKDVDDILELDGEEPYISYDGDYTCGGMTIFVLDNNYNPVEWKGILCITDSDNDEEGWDVPSDLILGYARLEHPMAARPNHINDGHTFISLDYDEYQEDNDEYNQYVVCAAALKVRIPTYGMRVIIYTGGCGHTTLYGEDMIDEIKKHSVNCYVQHNYEGNSSLNQRILLKNNGLGTMDGDRVTAALIPVTGYNSPAQQTVTVHTSDNGKTVITYNYTRIKYTITYNKNGGSGSMGNSTKYYGTNMNLAANGFSRTGYTFSKWTTNANGSGTAYGDRAVYSANASANLYAQWKPNTYTIKYIKGLTNGGGSTANTVHTYDTAKNLASNGFTGRSYSITFNQNKPLETSNTVTNMPSNISGNLQFYRWLIGSTYYGNAASVKNLTSTNNATLTATANWSSVTKNNFAQPKLTGYIFGGWYTNAACTGTAVTSITINPATTGYSTVLYAKWTPITYYLYYQKGLTSDTSTTSIGGTLTRNSNIQKSGAELPYIKCTYDKNIPLATLGSLKGRAYTVAYNTNKPISYSGSIPAIASSTGTLSSKNIWLINGSSNGTMGTTVVKPNYTATNNASIYGVAQWQDKLINSFSTPTAPTGWEFVGWYDNQAGNKSATVNDASRQQVINNSIGNITSINIKPNTSQFSQTLYAKWKRTIKLTFKTNGGTYKNSESDIVLTGVYYGNADGFTFNLQDGVTPASVPNSDVQLGKVNAYGTYNANGKNSLWTREDVGGTTYRLLGFSTDPDATEPMSQYDVYNASHLKNVKLNDNLTLYAVWEPILIANIEVRRTLGDANAVDSLVNNKTEMDATSAAYTIKTRIHAGEQGDYRITHSKLNTLNSTDNMWITSNFGKITNLYADEADYYYDHLNYSDSSGECLDSTGLNRMIKDYGTVTDRKFYMPVYIGKGSNDVEAPYSDQIYLVQYQISQYSYFYKNYVPSKGREYVDINCYIYIDNSDMHNPTDPIDPDDAEYNTISDLKTQVIVQ